MTAFEFVRNAIVILDNSSNFAEDFTRLKIQFFREYYPEYIFSIKFGADFFSDILNRIQNNLPIVSETRLGEYDLNFNKWLDKNHVKV